MYIFNKIKRKKGGGGREWIREFKIPKNWQSPFYSFFYLNSVFSWMGTFFIVIYYNLFLERSFSNYKYIYIFFYFYFWIFSFFLLKTLHIHSAQIPYPSHLYFYWFFSSLWKKKQISALSSNHNLSLSLLWFLKFYQNVFFFFLSFFFWVEDWNI